MIQLIRATNIYFAIAVPARCILERGFKAFVTCLVDSATGTGLKFSVGNGSSNSEERMRITHDGYVGVGTTAPTSLLQVSSGDRHCL